MSAKEVVGDGCGYLITVGAYVSVAPRDSYGSFVGLSLFNVGTARPFSVASLEHRLGSCPDLGCRRPAQSRQSFCQCRGEHHY